MPVAYTDLFNEALDDLTTSLTAVAGLVVVNDVRNISPPCVLIGAPSFTSPSMNNKFVRIEFPLQLITLGPSNLDALRSLLNLAALVFSAGVACTEGRPISLEIGGSILPAYEMNATMQAAV